VRVRDSGQREQRAVAAPGGPVSGGGVSGGGVSGGGVAASDVLAEDAALGVELCSAVASGDDVETSVAEEGGERSGNGAQESTTMARHVAGALADALRQGTGSTAERDLAQHRRKLRRVTVRVVLFLILVGAVVAGAWAVLRFYAQDAYYVGLRGTHVAVYQGRPGGFLGFHPRVVETSSLTAGEVLSYRVPELHGGVQEPSRQAADQFVVNLRVELCAVRPASPACRPTSSLGEAGGRQGSGTGGSGGARSTTGVGVVGAGDGVGRSS